MTKVLLSVSVVVLAILAGATSKSGHVDEATTRSVPAPDLPAVHLPDAAPTASATPAGGSEVISIPSVAEPLSGAGGAHDVGATSDNTGTQVFGSSSDLPQPGTCRGRSHSKSTSENGRQVRTTREHTHCSENVTTDDCSEGTCERDQ